MQVPFIANYRKEYIEPELNIEDLWKIWEWDEKVLLKGIINFFVGSFFAFCPMYIADSERDIITNFNSYFHSQWCQLRTRKENLHRLFEEMQDYQFNKIQESGDQPLDDDTRILQAEDIDRYSIISSQHGYHS